MVKFIVVTGGSLSGIGKGTCASSIGVVLKSQGLRVTAIKIDPYLNVDAGTISPMEHGEVFVLADGHEGDLDLGNYERALDISLTRAHNITTGKIFRQIIENERNGEYLGATVQIVPHVTDAIQSWIERVSEIPVDSSGLTPDVCLIEVGGTVGDIESMVYLQALHQFFSRLPREQYLLCHLTFVPQVGSEQKTKCAQHSFKALMEAGLCCDIVFARAQSPLEPSSRRKLSIFSGVKDSCVIGLPDLPCLYYVPQQLASQGLFETLKSKLQLADCTPVPSPTPLDLWNKIGDYILSEDLPRITVGIVAKYMGSNDTYLSIVKALEHAGYHAGVKVCIEWICAEKLERHDDPQIQIEETQKLKSCNGIITPGGFGERGLDGKIDAARFARENKIPFLGICLGMQTALIEGVRNLVGHKTANSEEFDLENEHKVIVFMPETSHLTVMGGTMRLGDRQTYLADKNTLAATLYGKKASIIERHRHRYEFNTAYCADLSAKGYVFSGRDERGQRLEIMELRDHPFFLGVQYHPELTSKPHKPNPCFYGLVLASAGKFQDHISKNGGILAP